MIDNFINQFNSSVEARLRQAFQNGGKAVLELFQPKAGKVRVGANLFALPKRYKPLYKCLGSNEFDPTHGNNGDTGKPVLFSYTGFSALISFNKFSTASFSTKLFCFSPIASAFSSSAVAAELLFSL